MMFAICLSALLALAGYVVAQSGVELDKPMLGPGGGGRRGPGAMLRFGCSQVGNFELYIVAYAKRVGCH